MINVVGGLIAIAIGILALINWPWRVVELIQGLIPIVFVAGGVVALAAGLSMVKEQSGKASKKSEDELDDE